MAGRGEMCQIMHNCSIVAVVSRRIARSLNPKIMATSQPLRPNCLLPCRCSSKDNMTECAAARVNKTVAALGSSVRPSVHSAPLPQPLRRSGFSGLAGRRLGGGEGGPLIKGRVSDPHAGGGGFLFFFLSFFKLKCNMLANCHATLHIFKKGGRARLHLKGTISQLRARGVARERREGRSISVMMCEKGELIAPHALFPHYRSFGNPPLDAK